jgi:uroporphyrinogen III methyltransferase / synthase
MTLPGKVTFVGAGCGDPRLLTARACEVLASAELVLFDPEIHPDILARLPEGTPRHPVTAMMSPERIGQMLAVEAKAGRHVVRLTWGDPLLFSAGDVEGSAVAKQGIALEVVPGITPFTAIGAFAGVPLTRASDVSPSIAVLQVTRGHEALHDWEKLAMATDTLAILCDAETVAETARSLVFYGRKAADHVTLVENVSLPQQRMTQTTLGQVPLLPRAQAARVIMAVGVHSSKLEELAWFESRPLFGKRVLVTRAREQAGATAALLRERGADAVLMPTIEIHAPSDPSPMIDALARIDRYGWVVFTSANGVERTWTELRRQGRDARAFGGAKIAAIGPSTAAALERCGLVPNVVAKDHKGEGLASELLAAIGEGRPRVLIARAEVARDVVPDALRATGCTVDVVAVYKTRSPPRPLLDGLSALLEAGEIDIVTFTSSSTVEHLCDALEARAPELLAKTCVASIGPITSETAVKRGLRVDVTAEEHTVPGLVRGIERHFSKRD